MSLHRSSLTRIADLTDVRCEPVPRHLWAWGDYIVAEVVRPPPIGRRVEHVDGRMADVDVGDQIVGALGVRAATLEATGTWEDIVPTEPFRLLSAGGLFGAMTSTSPFVPAPIEVAYRGHVLRGDFKVTMRGEVVPGPSRAFEIPVVLIIGSSMSAGKTASARKITRRLKHAERRVVAAKLTGADRYRDVLTVRDAGADAIFDFVDVGLPSTICPAPIYREAISELLSRMAATDADIAVIEAGASPLEPYNGQTCLDLLGDTVKMTVLCASDPYSVVGIVGAFGRQPDLVAGIACNTDAGLALVRRLTGIPAMRLVHRQDTPQLDAMLADLLGL